MISEELEQLLRKNIQEFENNQNFKAAQSDSSHNAANVSEHSDLEKNYQTTRVEIVPKTETTRVLSSQQAIVSTHNHLPLKYIDDFDSDEE